LSTSLRPFPLLLALAACGGASAPPPPVATATPSRTADDLRPMSSREGASASTVPAGPVDAQPLPPGHPPLEGAPSQGAPQGAPLPAGHPPIGAPAPGARSVGSIAGTIALSPRLQVAPTDVMYVMAKKGKSTLAVRRVDRPSFPFAFEISGGDAMVSGAAFEGPVDVVARISRTGDAIPAKGDLEGVAKSVKINAKDVRLTIDSVRQ
jgi:hypothetical protein